MNKQRYNDLESILRWQRFAERKGINKASLNLVNKDYLCISRNKGITPSSRRKEVLENYGHIFNYNRRFIKKFVNTFCYSKMKLRYNYDSTGRDITIKG